MTLSQEYDNFVYYFTTKKLSLYHLSIQEVVNLIAGKTINSVNELTQVEKFIIGALLPFVGAYNLAIYAPLCLLNSINGVSHYKIEKIDNYRPFEELNFPISNKLIFFNAFDINQIVKATHYCYKVLTSSNISNDKNNTSETTTAMADDEPTKSEFILNSSEGLIEIAGQVPEEEARF